MSRPRIVLMTSHLGYSGVPHAGGRYLKALCDVFQEEADLVVLAPGIPTNRFAVAQEGAPRRVLLLGGLPGRSPSERAVNWLAAKTEPRARRWDQTVPYAPFVAGLLRSKEARRALGKADVVDLQWLEMIRLTPLVRRLSPGARVVGTFHDAMSQLFEREPGYNPEDRERWRAQARKAQRLERRAVDRLDRAVVFSAKDAALIGAKGRAQIINPPLAERAGIVHRPPPVPTVVFVAHWGRDENEKAAEWLMSAIWPQVLSRVPQAQLRLVGKGASAQLLSAVARTPSVIATGYVVELHDEYSGATVAVVPLQKGSGVKFKSIEAMAHGVPVVATSVGAEGIEGPDHFVWVTDDGAELADALVSVLTHDLAATERARAPQEWVNRTYSHEQFRRSVLEALNLVADDEVTS